jgi:hypothetical protein
MRRAALFCAVLGFVAAGVGCNVITGQHDCTYDPQNMQLPPTNTGPQFPTVGAPYSGVVANTPPADLPATGK